MLQQNKLRHLLLILTLITLASCGGGGKDESKDGDTSTSSQCTVDVDGNFIFNNNQGNISFDLSSCVVADSKKPNDEKTCDLCDVDFQDCIDFGESQSGITDAECQERFDLCLAENSCASDSGSETTSEQPSEIIYQ